MFPNFVFVVMLRIRLNFTNESFPIPIQFLFLFMVCHPTLRCRPHSVYLKKTTVMLPSSVTACYIRAATAYSTAILVINTIGTCTNRIYDKHISVVCICCGVKGVRTATKRCKLS